MTALAHRAARLLVHLTAVIAPGHRRAELTEQWLADLAGTAELGLRLTIPTRPRAERC